MNGGFALFGFESLAGHILFVGAPIMVAVAKIAPVLFSLRGRIGGKSIGEYADNPKHCSGTVALAVQG